MDPAEIDKRFALEREEGADLEILGCTGGVPGGGFLYTNRDSMAVGLVLRLPELAASGGRPEEHAGGPEGAPGDPAPRRRRGPRRVRSAPHSRSGLGHDAEARDRRDAGRRRRGRHVPRHGDLARGRQFAIGSGAAAGETAVEALAAGDMSEPGLAGYRRRLETSFVLADHKKFRSRPPPRAVGPRAAPLSRVRLQPRRADVHGRQPRPKPGLLRLARRQARRSGLRLRNLARDAYDGFRTFG